MPRVGVEPTWNYFRQILSLVRIPISPPRRELKIIKLFARVVNRLPEKIARTLNIIQKNIRRLKFAV